MDFENDIIGCAYDCPAQDRKTDCPFNEIVHLPFKEKVIWVEGISRKRRETIVQYNLKCTPAGSNNKSVTVRSP